mgnify:CR=1 FL=1
MKERDLQSRVIRAALPVVPRSSSIEVKVSKGDSISYSATKEHQIRALYLSTTEIGMGFKIPDCGFQNPFDIFILKKACAYKALVFNLGIRGKNECVLVSLEKWTQEKERSTRKSITLTRAKQIGTLLW